MTEHEFNLIVTKRIIIGILAAICIVGGVSAHNSRAEHQAEVAVSGLKLETAKAERDTAMFNNMSRGHDQK